MDFRSNITQLLQPLSKEEIHGLKKFISSPYFNTNKNISDIFDELIKFHPKFDSKNLNKEYIYSKVFKGKPFNDSNMRWILSEITHLTENYFAQKRFDNNKLLKEFYISEEFVSRMDEGRLKKSVDAMKAELNNAADKDYMYFFYKYLCQSNELNEVSLFKKDKKAREMDLFFDIYLKSFVSYINHFIVGITFDYLTATSLASKYLKNGISKRINELVKLFNFEKIADFMEEKNEDAEQIRATVNMLNMYLYPDNDLLYEDFKNYIVKNEKGIGQEELSAFYHQLVSYLRLKIIRSKNKNYFRNELYVISGYIFKNNLHYNERTHSLNQVLYKLTLLNTLELEKTDEAEKFIEKYTVEISENHKEDAVNFSKAYLSFYKKDFAKALDFMNKIKANFFFTDQKILKIACFSEMEYKDECANEVKSFRKYLKTSKFLSAETKATYNKFLFFIPYLCRSGKGKNFLSKKKLLENLQDVNSVYLTGWLKRKIDGL
jgi:hypothetical protein